MYGEAPKAQTLKDGVFMPGSCSVGLIPGWYYVIFVNDSNEVSHCNGSQPVGAFEWEEMAYYLDTRENIKRINSSNKNKLD